jgi:hypothetical protein
VFRGDLGSAWGWSRNREALYLAYIKGDYLILSSFDVGNGVEKVVTNLRDRRFSYFIVGAAGLSMDPSGKSLAGSVWRAGINAGPPLNVGLCRWMTGVASTSADVSRMSRHPERDSGRTRPLILRTIDGA